MLIKSGLITQMSGSIGGVTGSHNRGGMYLRARAIPTNPNTGRQVTAKAMLADLAGTWSQSLLQVQREAWNLYAENVSVTNALGDSIMLSGQNHFIRANTPRLIANTQLELTTPLAILTAPATSFTLPMVGEWMVDSSTDENDLTLTFSGLPSGLVDDPQSAVIVQVGRPRDMSRNYFRGPWRLAGVIQGDDTTPPTSPVTLTGAIGETWPGAAPGNRISVRIRVSTGPATQPAGLSPAIQLNYDIPV